MPRNGSGVYSADWVNASPNTTIESAKQNAMVADLVADANAARPVTAGGTGATTAIGAADNLFTKSSDVASAATTDLSTATGMYVVITGTTTITAFGTEAAGVTRALRFASALTLTHNATSLILPGAANILTVAGDTAVFVSEGSGNWRCLVYNRNAAPQGEEYLGRVPGTNISALVKGSLGDYRTIILKGVVYPSTDTQQILLQTSIDNGSAYSASAGNYAVQVVRSLSTTVVSLGNTTSAGLLLSGTAIGNATNEALAFTVTLHDFNQAAYTRLEGTAAAMDNGGSLLTENLAGLRLSAGACNALRIIAASGNINGYVDFWGVR